MTARPGDAEPGDGPMLERFAASGEEAAFRTLVERHGPLVLGVCRRVLGDEHEAEDACQATFLVLARRASSIRKRHSVASWLYGVALRVASKARVQAGRRRTSELPGDDMSAPADLDLAIRELRAVLDEELHQLPEKYRAPLVLCYLEGKTKDDAATELGWPTGTVSGRLARARDLLRVRLERRGLALSTTLFVTLISETAAPAAVPPCLAGATTKAAVGWAAGQPLGSLVPSLISTLVEGVLHDMSLSKLKLVTAVLAAFLVIGGGAGMWALRPLEGAPIDPRPNPTPSIPAPAMARARTFTSAQDSLVLQLIDGHPVKILGMASPRGLPVAIPAGANWAIMPVPMGMMGGLGGGGGGGGFVVGGFGMANGVGGGFVIGGGGAGGGGGAPAANPNQGPGRRQLPRLNPQELQTLATTLKRQNVHGLALIDRDFTDQDLAQLKMLPALQTLLIRKTSITENGLKFLKDLPNLRELILEGDVITPAGLARLADCKKLHTIELRGVNVTDAVIPKLGEVKELKTLRLKYTALTAAGLKALADMQNLNSQNGLETLELVGSAITDEGVAHLTTLAGLRTLRLHLTAITDAGLPSLKLLPSLRRLFIDWARDNSSASSADLCKRPGNMFPWEIMLLNLDGRLANGNFVGREDQQFERPTGNITDKGLAQLKDMKDLTELGVCSDDITDAGLENLAGLTGLQRLRLGGRGLTEKGLSALKPLTALQALELFDGAFGPTGIAALKQLPKLRVLYLPLSTPKETGAKYVRGLTPRTKTWYGRPWLALLSPASPLADPGIKSRAGP